MLFVGFALLISVGIALLISADAGSIVGLSQQQTGQALPLIIILVLVASALVGRRLRLSEMLTNLILWVGIFGVALVGYAYRDDLSMVAARVTGEPATTRAGGTNAIVCAAAVIVCVPDTLPVKPAAVTMAKTG